MPIFFGNCCQSREAQRPITKRKAMKRGNQDNTSFDKLIDILLNKDVVKEPLPKQESFDKFIDKIMGKTQPK
jgi:hypothetical protein